MRMKFASMGFMFLALCLSSVWQAFCAEAAPSFTLTDIDGNSFSTSDFRGKVVVLTFVATRFIFCEAQANILMDLYEYFRGDMILLAIGVDAETHPMGGDTDEQLRDFKNNTEFSGRVARDTEGIAIDYNVKYVPTSFIIDQDGYIRHKHVGIVETQTLLNELQIVIPEFSSVQVVLIFMIAATLTIAVAVRRRRGYLFQFA